MNAVPPLGIPTTVARPSPQVFENLRMLQGAPGVQMHAVPSDVEIVTAEEDPDVRTRGGGIEHPAEQYDGE